MADRVDSLWNTSSFFSVVPKTEELNGMVFAMLGAVEVLNMLYIYQLEVPVGNLNSESSRLQDIQFCGNFAEWMLS